MSIQNDGGVIVTQYTSIPLIGDKELKGQLKVLAALNGTSVGYLVRQAIDKSYGDQLDKIAPRMSNQMDTRKTKNAQE